MKSTEIPKKEEPNDSRYSLGFAKKEKDKNNNLIQSQLSLKDNRARSAKPLLLRKYIPKLKPIKSSLNPSIIYLGGKDEYFNFKKYKENLLKNKNGINTVAEEDYEKNANSGDESYSYKNFYSNVDKSDDESDNFLNDNENSINSLDNINKINNNINIIITKKKKCVKNNINNIRKFLVKTKEKMILKKYNDDTSINTNTPYQKYFRENYGYKNIYISNNKNNNNNNELVSNSSLDYDFDYINKPKSKSIYVGNYKNKNRPPILGFLQMNENSSNTTLSSGFSEI